MANQGGDVSYIEDTSKFKKAKYILPVVLESEGIIKELKAEEIEKSPYFLAQEELKKKKKLSQK